MYKCDDCGWWGKFKGLGKRDSDGSACCPRCLGKVETNDVIDVDDKMKIEKLSSEYLPYVIDRVTKWWGLSDAEAMQEIDRWMDDSNNSVCFIGVVNGKPMATAVFDTTSDVDYSISAWNTLLWVEPEYRGNDYGSLLTQERFSWARERGYDCVYLDTAEAKEYHLKHGWEEIMKVNYGNTDCVIMKYDLLK